MFVGGGEKAIVGLRSRCRYHAVGLAGQRDGGHIDTRLLDQTQLGLLQVRVSRNQSEAVAVGMNDHIDEVRVGKRLRRPFIGRIVELPVGGPQLPQQPAEDRPVAGQSGMAAFTVEIILVPVAVLRFRILRVQGQRDVLDIVAVACNQPGHPVRPQCRDNAGRPAAPVIAGQDRPLDVQRIYEGQQVVGQGRLLTGSRGFCRQKARLAIAAQIGCEDVTACSGQQGRNRIVGAGIVGKAMQQDHRVSAGLSGFQVCHLQYTCGDMLDFHHPSLVSLPLADWKMRLSA